MKPSALPLCQIRRPAERSVGNDTAHEFTPSSEYTHRVSAVRHDPLIYIVLVHSSCMPALRSRTVKRRKEFSTRRFRLHASPRPHFVMQDVRHGASSLHSGELMTGKVFRKTRFSNCFVRNSCAKRNGGGVVRVQGPFTCKTAATFEGLNFCLE